MSNIYIITFSLRHDNRILSHKAVIEEDMLIRKFFQAEKIL